MPKIELAKDAREAAVRALAGYLKSELEAEVTPFEAQFLLDFIAERIGPYFYNQALADAQVNLRAKFELIGEALYELEKPVKA